jgi:hypothetical protein
MPISGACNRCPVCRAALGAPGSESLGQAQCPRCGAELWVLGFSQGPAFFPRRPGQTLYDLLAALAGPQLGFSASEIEQALKGSDELDVVEFLADVEDVMRSTQR